jgi:hypothetical protein
MKVPKIRCDQCRRWFRPYSRQRHIQKTCPRAACQRARHRQACQAYRRENPNDDDSRRPKIRNWARKESYWPNWRRDHPEYREREEARMRNKRRSARRVAKRDALREISLEKLRGIRPENTEPVAKRDALDRRVDQVVDYLVWKETSQNETLPQAVGV